ncbi:hypothetical protein PV325_007653 [Microctonus aethiopoides]|nr:hypothetical protein PV325_007653 [Microctonus aethiopoides]
MKNDVSLNSRTHYSPSATRSIWNVPMAEYLVGDRIRMQSAKASSCDSRRLENYNLPTSDVVDRIPSGEKSPSFLESIHVLRTVMYTDTPIFKYLQSILFI